MGNFISSFMSNESSFGKVMTKIYIIICANLMFVLFSLPIVTIGASYAALDHVMLKTLRGDGNLSPFKQFWIGFKTNFKQATIAWVVFAVLVVIGYFTSVSVSRRRASSTCSSTPYMRWDWSRRSS